MNYKLEVKSELNLGEPQQCLLDYAFRECNEDPTTRCQVLQEFRDLIYERGECTPHRTDDAFLLRFLRARNFVVERAHRLFVNYYNFKKNNPNFFDNVSLKHLQIVGDHDLICVPPYLDQSGRRLLMYRVGPWDPEKVPQDVMFQATMLILELAILEQSAQILGGVCIVDLEGLSATQAWYMNPGYAHKIIQIMVNSFPMKVHACHVLNQSWIFDTIFAIFKPLMTDIMKQRFFVHGSDMESLHKHIDPKYLPKRYGGVHPDYDYNDWIEYFKRDATIIKEMKSLGYSPTTEEEEE